MTVTLLMECVDVQIQTKEDKFCCSFSASLTFRDPDFNSESRAETSSGFLLSDSGGEW